MKGIAALLGLFRKLGNFGSGGFGAGSLLAALLAVVALLVVGCATVTGRDRAQARGDEPRFPFPQHAFDRLAVAPMLPTFKTRAEMDGMIVDLFRQILRNDLIVDSGGPRTGDGFRMVFRHFQDEVAHGMLDVSHIATSESQGYGMVILAYMAGSEEMLGLSPGEWIFGSTSLRDYFDAMLRTVLEFPSSRSTHLFAGRLLGYREPDGENRGGYRVDGAGVRTAPFARDAITGSATNGDMDIIYALVLADRQWGSGGRYDYIGIARNMLADLWRFCVHDEHHVLLLGDWAKTAANPVHGSAIRTSDFMLGHLKAFRDVDPAHDWQLVIDASLNAIADIRNAQDKLGNRNGFLPDFAVRGSGGWEVPRGNILGSYDNAFAFVAAHVPWRLGTAYLLFGDVPIGDSGLYRRIIRPLDDFARTFTHGVYLVGLGPMHMDGTSFEWVDPNWFVPPLAVTAAAVGAGRPWVDAFWGHIPQHRWDFQGLGAYLGDTNGDYVRLLVLLTITGNHWIP